MEEIENETNQEMEQICAAAESPEVSIFSFPDSIGEVLWDHDELDHEETDQDRTLTTLTTITAQTETPTSSATRKGNDYPHYHEQRNGNFRFYQNGTSGENANGSLVNPRPNIGYANGNLLPVTFKGYFRTTAV